MTAFAQIGQSYNCMSVSDTLSVSASSAVFASIAVSEGQAGAAHPLGIATLAVSASHAVLNFPPPAVAPAPVFAPATLTLVEPHFP